MRPNPELLKEPTAPNSTIAVDDRPITLAFALICGLFVIHALHYWVLIDDA
jgi:hypothetical protein